VVEEVPDPFFAPEPVPVVEEVPDPFFAPEPVPVVEEVPDPFFAPEPAPVVEEVPDPVFAPEPVPVFAPEPAPVAAPVVAAEEADDGPSLWERTSKRTKLIGLGVIGFAIFFFVAPNLLALLMMLAGVATLFLAIAAKNESGSGFMPPPFFATNTAIAGGFGSVLLAMVIMVIT
jgi:hypothetical protein